MQNPFHAQVDDDEEKEILFAAIFELLLNAKRNPSIERKFS